MNSGIIIEIKTSKKCSPTQLKTLAKTALKQIEEEKYLTYEMLDYYMGTTIKLNEKIESILRAYVDEQRALKDLSVKESIKTGWENYYELIDLYNSTEIKRTESRLKQLVKKASKLYEDYANDLINDRTYKELLLKNKQEQDFLELKLKTLTNQEQQLKDKINFKINFTFVLM